jgi:twinkle protein
MSFINWDDIDLQGKSSGTKKTTCPACSEERKKKTDKCLSVDVSTGLAFCHHCKAKSVRDYKEYEQKEYTLPQQDWSNYTNLSDGLVKWLASRGISQATAIEMKLTEESQYIPALNKEANCIVFNYFEADKVVCKKYRTGDKQWAKSKDSKSIFYNINACIGKETIYIVEGEMDVLAMIENGIKNVISVPNGANDNDNQWEVSKRYLDGVKRFIIATDNDIKGIELREKIAHRLGKYRCSYIEFKGKDANDDLLSLELDSSIANIKRFPVSGTFQVADLYDGIIDLYDNGLPKTMAPKSKSFGELSKVFSVMLGQVTTITGIPSHGKSNFNDWYVLNLLNDYSLKGSWFSPEHTPMQLYQTNLIEKVTGKSFWGNSKGVQVPRITKEGIDEYKEWANEKIYLTACDDGTLPTWDWLLEKFKEQLYSFGINIFVVDAFNKLILPKGNKIDAINEVLTKLTHFAQSNDVLVFLVAHPTKMRKDEKTGAYEVPTLYDVSGSADFRNQTHNGYTIHRIFDGVMKDGTPTHAHTKFINTKTKFSFQGDIGAEIEFNFDVTNGRYYANGIEPKYNMIYQNDSLTPLVEIDADDFDYTPF